MLSLLAYSHYVAHYVTRREILKALNLDAIVVSSSHNFAWLTCGGRNYVNMSVEVGVGSLYIDAQQIVLVSNKIEGHRLMNEELIGLQSEIQLFEENWFEQSKNHLDVAKILIGSENVRSDMDLIVEATLQKLRTSLTPYEMDLYRTLGKDCGKIIGEVAIAIRPSMSEWEIAGSLTGKCYECGIIPVVVLIAADERIDTNRHPLPTNKRVKNKAMVVLCGRRAGLIVSLTRVVYITTKTQAQIPEDLLNRHHAATFVDAVALVHTKPGAQASTIFKAIQDAYATKGFEGEWRLHHQGGCTAYKSREWVASSSSTAIVGLNQAFAWNPSVSGTKSEDTILVNDKGELEIISVTPNWPTIVHKVGDMIIHRPAILHLAF